MTAAEYRSLYPPPADPRERTLYEAGLRAMEAGEVPWGPPPQARPPRRKARHYRVDGHAGRDAVRLALEWAGEPGIASRNIEEEEDDGD